ncbi:uncharacterized protein LOC109851751 isoform X2 [Pseudomyrmex gracilis]|uniref:uncharacterized protein LOC109851751 isoform X2 n=1 Tax=Pseudomyrmex gracilis TaxID=219809 RepID=UPI000995CEAD|nr:uncharacterized protein LOC109851751 isoform X2 [Pseudomyrmex gracilis]
METDKPSRSSTSRSLQRGSYRGRSGRRRKRRRKPLGERICDWVRALIAFLFSNVGIVCLVVGYTIAGAFLFAHIEGKRTSPNVADDVIQLRNLTAATLWELTSKENVFSEKIWKAKVRVVLESYQKKVVSAIKNGYDGVEENKWTFAGAFLYSLTVITTIGYGNICPKTKWGKVATIVYAIIGMPLFLLYLSNIGDILARSFKWTYARCCLCKCRGRSYGSTNTARTSEISNDPVAKRNRWQVVNARDGDVDASSLDPEETSPRDGEDGSVDEGDGNDEDDDDESDSYDPQHVTVYLGRCDSVFGMGGLEHAGRFLFLLRLFVDHRLRGFRPRRQDLLRPRPRTVFHLLLHVPDARNGADCHVLQSHARGGDRENALSHAHHQVHFQVREMTNELST